MAIKKIALLVCLIVMVVACTKDNNCTDDNYSDDHAVNVARCLQSLEDGTAYEIDEALTAKAPWKVGDIVAKFGNGEGNFYLREFLGVTKAGYYLVQDFESDDKQKDVYDKKKTEPFAIMSRCAVTDESTNPLTSTGMTSVCGAFTSYHDWKPKNVFVVEEQGVFLNGDKNGVWIRYYSNGDIWDKKIYRNYFD